MGGAEQRTALERLIRERREGYAGLSRLLGRNPAYIQQFIKRGSPRKLDADDLRTLARYFDVSEADLGGRAPPLEGQLVRVPQLDVGASAGHGAIADRDALVSHVAFDRDWLRQLTDGRPADLSFIRVQGDSMNPTLSDGDDILVDASDGIGRLRDGIYVMRSEDTLMVKRLAVSPAARTVTIKSDNPAYPEWRDCDLAILQVIGRVVWAGRRLR